MGFSRHLVGSLCSNTLPSLPLFPGLRGYKDIMVGVHMKISPGVSGSVGASGKCWICRQRIKHEILRQCTSISCLERSIRKRAIAVEPSLERYQMITKLPLVQPIECHREQLFISVSEEGRHESWGGMEVLTQSLMRKAGFKESRIRKLIYLRTEELENVILGCSGLLEKLKTTQPVLEGRIPDSLTTTPWPIQAERSEQNDIYLKQQEEHVAHVMQYLDFIVSEEAYQENGVEIKSEHVESIILDPGEHYELRGAAIHGDTDDWCGYWVGPSIEDGWGYVTAFIS